jgi:NTE family protein
MLNGRLLADGGLMNPVPIAPTVPAQAEATVAVSLGGDRRDAPSGPPVKESAAQRPVEEWADRFRRTASNLLDRDVIRSIMGRFSGHASGTSSEMYVEEDELFEMLPAGLGKADVIAQSIEAMQTVLTRYRLAGYPPDVLVSIPRDACRSLDFHRAAEMIELGRTATQEALDQAGLSANHPS